MSLLKELATRLISRLPFCKGCAVCKEGFPPLHERAPAGLVCNFPVDLVYTWVDGADPALAERRNAYLPSGLRDQSADLSVARHRDNDELRYSLRSVARYASFFRRIFIVTDRQVPSWLKPDPERVRIIDHSEIIPEAFLPTFSSRVIEAYLHRIPGLAEHYVYCNDDFFFSAPCRPGDFFTANGLPYCFNDWRAKRRKAYRHPTTPHARSHGNVRRYMEQKGIRPAPDLIVAHGPYPQTISNAAAAYAFFEEVVKRFSRSRFRNNEGLVFPSHAIPLWAYAYRKTVPCDQTFYYLNTKRYDRRLYYSILLREQDSGTLPLFFCLNDVGDGDTDLLWRRDLADFLNAFYPEPGTWER